jgi:hypothetical protein
MAETRRLIREKEHAVHAVAAALLEHGELIGDELEEVFDRVDSEHPAEAGLFERQIVVLPRLFGEAPAPAGESWPSPSEGVAAARPDRSPIGPALPPGVGGGGLLV